MNYEEFIKSKHFKYDFKGIDISRDDLSESLFDYQKDLVYIALKKGRFALFAMTGTGKTAMEAEWAYHVHKSTGKPVLILAPIAVAPQTINESMDIIGKVIIPCKTQDDVENQINITNYEKLHHFDADSFGGVALDESSILKSLTSKTKDQLIDMFKTIPFKLAATATPSPNDYMELGNHAEFLGVMSQSEMLSMFFINDTGNTGSWRLKKHAEEKFWEWVATWAAVFTKPSDLGYSEEEDEKYQLPNKYTFEHIVESDPTDSLFVTEAVTLNERRKARKDSIVDRCKIAAKLVNESDDIWLIWCDLNAESELLTSMIDGAVEVSGSHTDEHKTKSMMDFADGKIKCLVTKPKIAGFGMNWQVCHNMAFVGLSDSFEQIFQAERRCYRFGQKHDVNVHVIISESEGSVKSNIERKEADFIKMINALIEHTKRYTLAELKAIGSSMKEYDPQIEMKLPKFIKE